MCQKSFQNIKGVHDFLEVAEANKQNDFMCCPCPICGNTKSYSDRKILHTHLLYKGFMPHYNVWTRHGEIGVMMEDGEEEEDDDNYVPPEYGDAATGEAAEDQEEPDDVPNDAATGEAAEDQEEPVPDDDDLRRVIVDARTQCESQKEKLKFDRMLEDHKKGLYPNCEDGNTKLGTVLELLQWKAENAVPNKGFEKLLKILKKKLSKDNELPDSTYATKKVVCPLGLEVQKIHACPNDCILYRGAYKDLNACPVCGALRYKIRRDDPGDVDSERPRKRFPAKVMWYALIIPRLKRLFRNKEHAKLMRWHREDRKKDGKSRAPADGSQWRKIERKYWAEFAADPRNVWFGLSTDGLNPFGEQSSNHSTWPVTLCIYNLPPVCAHPTHVHRCHSTAVKVLQLMALGTHQCRCRVA